MNNISEDILVREFSQLGLKKKKPVVKLRNSIEVSKEKRKNFYVRLKYSHEKYHNLAQKIQKTYRGYICRKKLNALKDHYTPEMLLKHLKYYNDYVKIIVEINTNLKMKKIRNVNFPSDISENLVKFAFRKKYKIMPTWYTVSGDLTLLKKRIEVKCSSDLFNGGPSSFGPKEIWDYIYFVDCCNISKLEVVIYEIKLSNSSVKWKNLMINKKESYEDQCNQGRRPHICFKSIQSQLLDSISILFSGHVTDLIF